MRSVRDTVPHELSGAWPHRNPDFPDRLGLHAVFRRRPGRSDVLYPNRAAQGRRDCQGGARRRNHLVRHRGSLWSRQVRARVEQRPHFLRDQARRCHHRYEMGAARTHRQKHYTHHRRPARRAKSLPRGSASNPHALRELLPPRAQVQAMVRLAEAHEIGAVGVSKFSARQMELTYAELAKHGIALASNQVQINLLHRKIESNGVLDTARRLGVTLIAYSPLRSGILTAKFHDDPGLVAKMPRRRRKLFAGNLDRTVPLIDGLRQVAVTHSATVSQV